MSFEHGFAWKLRKSCIEIEAIYYIISIFTYFIRAKLSTDDVFFLDYAKLARYRFLID